jgi:hypothetical protein
MDVKAWFSRRLIRADVRPSEMVMTWGGGVLRLEQYVREGPGGRLFWRVAGAFFTLVFLGGVVVMLTLPWHHPDAQPGAPAWWTWALGLPAGVVLAWVAALLSAGVRAMHRHRAEPVSGQTH